MRTEQSRILHACVNMSVTFRLVEIAGLVAAVMLFGACGKKESAPLGPQSAVSATSPPVDKVYLVGTDAAYPPFEWLADNGDIVGFDIEVMQALSNKAGIRVKFVNTPWETLFTSLALGDVDMVVSAVTVTAERKSTIAFSDPYFLAQQLIAVKDGSKVTSLADLAKLRVGVQIGTIGDDAVTKLLGTNSLSLKRFESTALALMDLGVGGVDAVVGDSGVLIHHLVKNPTSGLKTVSDQQFMPQHYGVAIRKGNAELLQKVDKGLADIKIDGSYGVIYIKYFGRAPDVPRSSRDAAVVSAASPAAPSGR